MTYPIADVIYGCPFPSAIAGNKEGGAAFQAAMEEFMGHDDLMIFCDETDLWESNYSASPDNDPAGFFGTRLHCADGYWELKAEWFVKEVPVEVRSRVDREWEKLPEKIKEHLGRPRLAIAWSDS